MGAAKLGRSARRVNHESRAAPLANRAIFPIVSRLAFVLGVLVPLAACNRGPKLETPAPGATPLAAYATQRIALTPTAIVRTDSLGWVQALGGAQAVRRQADSVILTALADRGLGGGWVLPAELMRGYERNRSYASNPYQLSVEPLRAPKFVALSRYGEPLATQLRTMIALHGDTRVVVLPVEVRFERVADGGRSVLRVAVLDPRFAEARWVGELTGESTSVPARALAEVGRRFADLFTAP